MIKKEINIDAKSLSRFIRLVAASHDSPTLIRRIAEHYPNMVYCSAFFTSKNSKDQELWKLHQELRAEVHRQGFSFDSVSEKLTAVALVLGLSKQTPESIQMNYYDILGILPDADALEIKKAYRFKALKTHPDTSSGEQAASTTENEVFHLIQDAYDVLSNPALKHHYDVSRNQKSLLKWSENETISGVSNPVHRRPPFMRTFGYPLTGVILLLACVTVIADMVIRENSLDDGLGNKAAVIMAPAINDKKPEPAVQYKREKSVEENDDIRSDAPKSDLTAEKMASLKSIAPEKIPEATVIAAGALQNHGKALQQTPGVENIAFSSSIPSSAIQSGTFKQIRPVDPVIPITNIDTKIQKSEKIQTPNAITPAFLQKRDVPIMAKTTSDPTKPASGVQTKSKPSVAPAPSVAASSSKNVAEVVSKKSTDFTAPLTAFLKCYCQAYENRDFERFMAFFSENAVENNTPLYQLISKYRDNFQNIIEIKYTIDIASYTIDLHNILLNGRFSMKWLKRGGDERRHSSGNIQMDLIANGDSFLVQRLSYQFDNQ